MPWDHNAHATRPLFLSPRGGTGGKGLLTNDGQPRDHSVAADVCSPRERHGVHLGIIVKVAVLVDWRHVPGALLAGAVSAVIPVVASRALEQTPSVVLPAPVVIDRRVREAVPVGKGCFITSWVRLFRSMGLISPVLLCEERLPLGPTTKRRWMIGCPRRHPRLESKTIGD